MDGLTVTPNPNITIPPPTLPSFNLSSVIGDFTGWWNAHTFGVFSGILGALFIFSVFLKTRSLSATLVATGAVATVVGPQNWLLLSIALVFTALLWGIWRRAAE